MKRILIFTLYLFAYVNNMQAQFVSSENVYCYEYDYTNNDGIKYKSGSGYYFVNFQNEVMGFVYESKINTIRQNLLDNPNYYDEKAIENLADSYSRWKDGGGAYGAMWAAYANDNDLNIILYTSQYSTASKYTYRVKQRNLLYGGYGSYHWGDPHWTNQCYSFSVDKSEMIVWSTSDPENRKYYKRIDVSNLKPNVDFLY